MTGAGSPAPGSRVRCSVCGSEAIVTVSGDGVAEMRCCDTPLQIVAGPTVPAS